MVPEDFALYKGKRCETNSNAIALMLRKYINVPLIKVLGLKAVFKDNPKG